MSKTLRLLMPQWQGGNNPPYSLGARLLEWLAPVNGTMDQAEVPVELYRDEELSMENGIIGRSELLRQLDSAEKIIEAHQPDRIITFGGDCLVSQAPFAYLNEKYDGKLGVLWLDAHPDVSTPEMYPYAHASVLGNLLGEGIEEFASKVKVPLNPELVMYGGLQKITSEEEEIVKRLKLGTASASELAKDSTPVLQWIKENNIKYLAIHLDLDVLDPAMFRSLLFACPEGVTVESPCGTMTLPQIGRLIQDVSGQTDIVGMSFAEHLPWDAIKLQEFLGQLPIFNQ